MDIKTNVPLDAQTLATQAQTGATVDPSGWVQNINGAAIQNALTGYQAQVQTYIDSQKANATVGDVLGTKTITRQNNGMLTGSLPYRTIATGGKFTALPASLRHFINLSLYVNTTDKATGSSALSLTISLSALNGHRLGVTYQPATAVDTQLIQSYQAQGATSLPAYLIRLIPLIQVDGVTVASGTSIGMGQDQIWDATLSDPENINTSTKSFYRTAGDEMVFGIDGNGIIPETIQQRFAGKPSNTAAENLNQVALYYWMEFDMLNNFAAKAYGVIVQRLPSIGLFSSPLEVSYYF
jgi:hypothetical protein